MPVVPQPGPCTHTAVRWPLHQWQFDAVASNQVLGAASQVRGEVGVTQWVPGFWAVRTPSSHVQISVHSKICMMTVLHIPLFAASWV